MSFAKLGLFFLVLVAAAALLYTQQRRLIFPAPAQYPQAPPPGFRLVHPQTNDGLRLAAFYRAAQPDRRIILFFHGNGDNLLGAIEATRGFAATGNGLLLVEYRGYGGNPGSPGEAGLYRDGNAAMRWLAAEGVAVRDIIVVGNSIGSGPATEMAWRHDVAALILVSGFSSLPDVVGEQLPLAPRWLVRDRFVMRLRRDPHHGAGKGAGFPDARRRRYAGEAHQFGAVAARSTRCDGGLGRGRWA